MARETFDSWVPVEYGADVVQRPDVLSAIESSVKSQPMNTESKVWPRSGAASVAATAKGSAFSEDAGSNDKVTLTAVKFGTSFRIANEDIDDSIADIISIKQGEFARAYAKAFDNACLGTTAVANLGTVPFNSLYYSLTTTNAATGYTANANVIQTAAGVAPSYDNLSALLGLVEDGEWYDEGSQLIIAHPSLKGTLRSIKDDQHRPIFIDSDFGGNGGTPSTLFGLPIKFSLGAKTSATNMASPNGNPLLFVVNPNYLMNGTRTPVEATVDKSVSIQTDEALLVMRTRKAFAVGIEAAHAVLEVVPV